MRGYSEELAAFINENRMEYTTLEMVQLIKRKFKKNITPKALRKYYDRHNLEFKKIYRRTDKNVNAKPIGTESNPDKNGLIRIKINDKQWQYKQRYIYEKYYGEIPEGYVVIFADGDKTNFEPENLYAVDEKTAKTLYCLTKEDKPVQKDLTLLGLKIAEVKNKINRRNI